MAVKILEVKREGCPAARLIGKRYDGCANWGEWWGNGWFAELERLPATPFNGDAYIGAVHIVNGMPERWIGMIFPAETEVPDGFEYADIQASDFVVCYLYDKEGSGEFYTMEAHDMCLDALSAKGFKRKEDDWCFERYNCPRFTAPDENGCVILDYALAIEN